MKFQKITILLMYAGCLPFIFCSVSLMLGFQILPYLGDITKILQFYTLVIASFMAGTHWGQYLIVEDKSLYYLPGFSNLVAIFIWFAAILMPIGWFIFSSILVFILLLIIDYKMAQKKLFSKSYFRVRLIVTTIVSIALLNSIIAVS